MFVKLLSATDKEILLELVKLMALADKPLLCNPRDLAHLHILRMGR